LNTKDIALVVLVILTVVFASLTASEYYRVGTLGSEPSTTVTTTTTVICPLDSVCPPFTYAPSSPLRIDLVQASNETVNGESHVGFDVKFHNIGDAPSTSQQARPESPSPSPVIPRSSSHIPHRGARESLRSSSSTLARAIRWEVLHAKPA
jgi:hypothetical protein